MKIASFAIYIWHLHCLRFFFCGALRGRWVAPRIPSISVRRRANTNCTEFPPSRSPFRSQTFRGHCLRLSLRSFLTRASLHARPVRAHNADRTLRHNITLETSRNFAGMQGARRVTPATKRWRPAFLFSHSTLRNFQASRGSFC